MNEREELQRAREELKSSIKVVQKNLKIFGKAVVSSQKAALRNVGNNIINTYKQLQSDIYIHKLNKEIARYQKEREAAIKRAEALEEANRMARNRENTRALEAEARRVKAQEREERELKFKRGVKQKTNSLKSRIGKVKNSFLRTLTTKNIDLKIREAFDKVGIFGLTAVGAGLAAANKGKNKITDFTSTQIAKLTEYRIRKQEEKQERARQESIRRAEALEEKNRRLRNKENTVALEQSLRLKGKEEELELDEETKRNIENTVMTEKEDKRTLKFKDGVKQKASSLKSKLAKVKNSFLKTLTTKNIDLKLRDAFDKVGIFSLSAAGVGLAAINNGKEKVTDLTSTQIAKLTEYRIRKQEEKQERDRQSAIKEAEALEEANIRSRTMNHKKGMIEALTAQERTEYDLKHEENLIQKEQLKQALLAQRNRLLNIQNEELEAKPKSR